MFATSVMLAEGRCVLLRSGAKTESASSTTQDVRCVLLRSSAETESVWPTTQDKTLTLRTTTDKETDDATSDAAISVPSVSSAEILALDWTIDAASSVPLESDAETDELAPNPDEARFVRLSRFAVARRTAAARAERLAPALSVADAPSDDETAAVAANCFCTPLDVSRSTSVTGSCR